MHEEIHQFKTGPKNVIQNQYKRKKFKKLVDLQRLQAYHKHHSRSKFPMTPNCGGLRQHIIVEQGFVTRMRSNKSLAVSTRIGLRLG